MKCKDQQKNKNVEIMCEEKVKQEISFTSETGLTLESTKSIFSQQWN